MDESYPVNFIEEITSHIIEGSTLPKFCLSHKLRYGALITWLHADADRYQRYMKAVEMRNELFVNRIIEELGSIAFSDMSRLYDDNGRLLDPKDWPDDLKATVQAVESQEEFSRGEHIGTSKRVKLWDKLRALELLGKNLSMFRDRVEHTGTLSLEQLIAQSYRDPETPAPTPQLPA